jgi:hypothetical protein
MEQRVHSMEEGVNRMEEARTRGRQEIHGIQGHRGGGLAILSPDGSVEARRI